MLGGQNALPLLLLDPLGGEVVSNDEPMTNFMRDNYRETRYLESADEHVLFIRLKGLLSAVFDLDFQGEIVYRPEKQFYSSALVDVLEELRLREIPHQDAALRFSRQLMSTFEPERVRVLAEALHQLRGKKCLFKLMEKVHAHHLVGGTVRFTPASWYANEGLSDAVRDDEHRLDHVLKGLRITTIDGRSAPVIGDRISRQSSGEYLVSCFSVACDLRLFNLFKYDACVVISNATEFVPSVREEYGRLYPTDTFLFDAIEYLDPFREFKAKKPIELVKSIDFAFEREFRFVAYNRHREVSRDEVRTISVDPRDLDSFVLEF